MVKGQRAEAFCTIPDKCMELQGFLDEGEFDVATGLDGREVLVLADPTKECKAGTPVVRVAGKDRTYEKASTNDFDAIVRADAMPVKTIKEDEMREALLEFPLVGFNYHIPLADDNKAISAGDIVGWTGTKWDKLTSSQQVGLIFVAIESATANSGKYIDAFLKKFKSQ